MLQLKPGFQLRFYSYSTEKLILYVLVYAHSSHSMMLFIGVTNVSVYVCGLISDVFETLDIRSCLNANSKAKFYVITNVKNAVFGELKLVPKGQY